LATVRLVNPNPVDSDAGIACIVVRSDKQCTYDCTIRDCELDPLRKEEIREPVPVKERRHVGRTDMYQGPIWQEFEDCWVS
jgi:hypothetical protein